MARTSRSSSSAVSETGTGADTTGPARYGEALVEALVDAYEQLWQVVESLGHRGTVLRAERLAGESRQPDGLAALGGDARV